MTKRLMLAAALVLAAALASAQQMPPGKWWQRPEIVRQLGLTRDQQDKLDEVFRGAANGLIDARADVEKLQVGLRGELDRPQIRRAEVLRIAGQLSDARGRLFAHELTMLLDMRGVLTDQQWNQMRDVLDRPRDGGPQRQRPMQRRKP
jgi:Spy/CpxP family protein refolding chaperone